MKNSDNLSRRQEAHSREWQTLIEFVVHNGSVIEQQATSQVAAGVAIVRVLVPQISDALSMSESPQAKARLVRQLPRGWGFFVVHRQSGHAAEPDTIMKEIIEVFLYREGEQS